MVRRIQYRSLLLLLPLLALSACSTLTSKTPSLAPTESYNGTTTYTVRAGDTLRQIAARYNVTVDELVQFNSDRYPILSEDPTKLRVGWQLLIPNPRSSATPSGTIQANFPNLDLYLATKLTVDGVNAARVQQGLGPLQVDSALARMAADRSYDMIAREYFSHYDPVTGQEQLLLIIQTSSFSYRFAGENIAEIRNDADWVPALLSVAARYNATDLANEFVQGWLNSPEHRENIMNSHFRRTGVAIGYSSDGRRVVATQLFAD